MAPYPTLPFYRIGKIVGSGSSGTVYLAMDDQGRRYAVKIFSTETERTPEGTSLSDSPAFLRELETLSGLSHPHIVRMLDFGQTPDTRENFLVFEHHEGEDFIAASKSVSAPDFYQLVAQILRTLDYLHSRGIVHGDLKPQNLLVLPGASLGGSGPCLKMLDFGYSESGGRRSTTTFRGSPHYVAPEIIEGQEPSPLSDLYALGVILYECIAGSTPYQGDIGQVLQGHLQGTPPRLESAGLAEIAPLVTQLMHRNPSRRPATALHAFSTLARLCPYQELTEQTDETWAARIGSAPLVGRSEMIRRWYNLLQADRQGAGHVVLLCGPPGSGKTRLARELALRARALGHGVLNFAGSAGSGRPEPQFGSSRPDVLTVDIPSVQGLGVLSRFVHDLVERLRPDISLVTVDTLSISRAELAAAGRELADKGPCEIWRLQPLGLGDTGDLLGSVFTTRASLSDLIAWLLAESGGNPRQIQDALLMYLKQSHITSRLVAENEISQPSHLTTLRAAARTDPLLVDRLTGTDRAILDVMAIASTFLELTDIAHLLERPEVEIKTACEDLVHRGLLTFADEASSGVRVSGQMITRGIRDGMPDGPARSLNARLGAFWASRGPDHAALARAADHFRSAGLIDRAAEYYSAAARRADEMADYRAAGSNYAAFFSLGVSRSETERRTRLESARCLVKAGRTLDALAQLDALLSREDLQPAFRVECLLAKSDLGFRSGDIEMAQRAALSVRELAEKIGDDDLEVNASAQIGGLLCWLGRESEGAAMLFHALTSTHGRRSAKLRYSVLASLAGVQWRRGEYLLAIKYLKRSARLRRTTRLPLSSTAGLQNLGILEAEMGLFSKSRLHHLSYIKLARQRGMVGEEAASLNNLGEAFRLQGRWKDALRQYAASLALIKSGGNDRVSLVASGNIGLVCSQIGQYSLALSHLRHVLNRAHRLKAWHAANTAWGAWCTFLLQIGRFHSAGKVIRYALQEVERRHFHSSLLDLHLLRGNTLAEMGRLDEAVSVLTSALESVEGRAPFESRLSTNLHLVNLEMREFDLAPGRRELLDSLLATTRKKKMRWHLGFALVLHGRRLAGEQRFDQAEAAVNEAIAIFRKICDRTGEWQAHYWLGRIFEKRLQYERALKHYRISALTINELALNIDEDRYRKSFLEQPKVREVLDRYRRLRSEVGKQARHDLASLSRSERVSRRMLDALNTIGQQLSSILDLDELLRSVLDLAIRNVGAERGIVFLGDDTTGEMRLECARGMDRASLDEVSSYSTSVVREVAGGRTLLTVDVGKDRSLSAFKSLVLHEIKSILCVPMRTRGRVVGVIYLDTRRAAQLFSDKERSFVESFASQAAIAIDNARLFGHMRSENAWLKRAAGRSRFETLVGSSPAMRRLRETIAGVLETDCNVLIRGESGTGKELVARALHDNGPRRDRKFMAVDCGAIPEHLLEAELFGHARGAFTGADRDRTGLIQEADGGTVFLDEITNTSLAFQARLLRVLQEKEVRRLGENAPRRVDVRFLAATNADISALIAGGRFRQDLFYRLNVVGVDVPPLRDRKEDIPLLVGHFLKTRAGQSRPIKAFEPAALDALGRHDWPGNVRELENVLERLLILAPGSTVRHQDVPAALGTPGASPSRAAHAGGDGPKTGEQAMIEDALRRFRGDKAKTARHIGWNRQKLYRRMKAYGIPADYGQGEREAV